jgi:hypothetical protein
MFDDHSINDSNNGETPFGSLSSMKMVYLQEMGLYIANQKGLPSKKVNGLATGDYLVNQINDFFHHLFDKTKLPSDGIGIYTRLTCDDADPDDDAYTKIYRADPLWTTRHVGDIIEGTLADSPDAPKHDPWHDFAYFKWITDNNGTETIIPGRIIFFLSFQVDVRGKTMIV